MSRTRAFAHFTLARALVAAGDDKTRAVQLAHRAREVFQSVGAAGRRGSAEVDAWLAEHEPAPTD